MACNKRFVLMIFIALTALTILGVEDMEKKQKFPSSFVNLLLNGIDETTLFLVEVDKQRGLLIEFKREPLTMNGVKEFVIATGKQKGAKRYEWDLRTPQGYYEITQYRPAHTLEAKFGPAAFVLNYPNPLDRFLNRTGSGIWIHGTDREDFIDYDSEGCVRLRNEDAIFMIDYLKPRKTPVIITEEIEWITEEELLAKKETLLSSVSAWQVSWQSNDVLAYLSHYDRSFYAPDLNMDIVRWTLHKKGISEKTDRVELSFSDVNYIFFDDYFLLEAIQTYRTPTYQDRGRKRVLWQKNEGRWLIIREDWRAL